MLCLKKQISILLAGLLAVSLAACGQTSVSEPDSSQPESIPASSSTSGTDPIPDSEPVMTPDQRALQIEIWNLDPGVCDTHKYYTTILDPFIEYVGADRFEEWKQQAEKDGVLVNIRTFVDHFEIDRDTFLDILKSTYEAEKIYPSFEAYLETLYTNDQLDAVFDGDEEDLRLAFGFSQTEGSMLRNEPAPPIPSMTPEERENWIEKVWSDPDHPPFYLLARYKAIRLVFLDLAEQSSPSLMQTWKELDEEHCNIRTFVDHFGIDRDTFIKTLQDSYELSPELQERYPTVQDYINDLYTEEQLDAIFGGDEKDLRFAFYLPEDYPVL